MIPKTAPIIRIATYADLNQVRDCAVQAYTPYVAAIGCPPAPMVQDFEQALEQGRLWVGTPFFGFMVMYRDGDVMHLENLAILPAHHGQGFGKAMVDFCAATARQQGLKRIELYTNVHMVANQMIYQKLGFVEVDRRYEDGFDRVYFAKAI